MKTAAIKARGLSRRRKEGISPIRGIADGRTNQRMYLLVAEDLSHLDEQLDEPLQPWDSSCRRQLVCKDSRKTLSLAKGQYRFFA